LHTNFIEHPQIALVVTRDAVNSLSLVWLLSGCGVPALVITDFDAAPQMVERFDPHLVVLDADEADGRALLKDLREQAAGRSLIAFTSAGDFSLDEVAAQRPDAIFGNPIDLDDLRNWLIQWQAHHAPPIAA